MIVSALWRGTPREVNPLDRKKLGVRILLGVVIGIICISMLWFLVPGMNNTDVLSSDNVADVGGQPVSVAEVRQQLTRMASSGQMPPQFMAYYARQIVDNLVFEKMLEIEAKRLGISVSESEVADRIKSMLPPAAIENGAIKMDVYESLVSQNGGTVKEFETAMQQGILQEKVQELVTSTVSVSPEEVQVEFLRKNEKIKMDYAVLHPESLESQVQVSDADLSAYYEKNKARYLIQEQRVARYILIDPAELQAKVNVPDAEIQAYYNSHLDSYKVEDRAQISGIKFNTMGKTDAEIAEIHKKADDILKEVNKPGAKFDELAKKNSEDTATKDKGGDMGWIIRHQAMPEIERAAFSLPKGSVSDVIQTQLGFYIIKVTDRETARTKSQAEVLPSILETLSAQKAQAIADDDAQKISDTIRRTAHPSLDEIAKQFGLTVGETKPVTAADPIPELGASPELHAAIFSMRLGEVSQPLLSDRGHAVISIKSITPAHQGTLEEVRAKLTTDFRHEKAVDLAKQRAAELAKRAQGGEDFSKVAKALNIEVKTSDLVSRDGSIPNAGTARQFSAAFSVPAGKVGDPVFLGNDWLVFRVADHQMANPVDFEKQKKEIEDTLLNSKRQFAFESFRMALEDRFRAEGKLSYNKDALTKLAGSS
jgi:peptidyl-prolyl cis-trans isomerase D